MDFLFAILFVVLIVVLFDKVSKLKKQIDLQDLKIRKLQDQLQQQSKTMKQDVSSVLSKKQDNPKEIFVEQKTPDSVPKIESSKEQNNDLSTIISSSGKTIDKSVNSTITFIKENFLTIVGVITLVLGIGYFVKYAIDQDWINETFRVFIGLAVGIGIISLAHRIRKNFSVFSSILIGGGISVLYFTLTIAFREYHLFSQNITFSFLTLVTVCSIVLSLLYNRQVLALFSIIGGFSAPLMISTGESNFIFLFSYLVLLNLGMLYMTWKKNWQIISFVSFVFTFLYSLVWINEARDHTQFLFFGCMCIIFICTSLFNYFTRKEFSVWDSILYVANTIVSTVLISIALNIQFHPGFISFIFGIINGVFALYIFRGTQYKLLLNTTTGLSISLLTIAIGLEFKANVVAICFAIQSTLLLFLWKKSHENIFKIFFILMFPFLFVALCINWSVYFDSYERLPIIFNKVFITSSIVLVCSLFNISLMKDFETEERFLGFKLIHSKFIFVLTSILLMYLGILLELVYQIEPYYSIYLIISYIFIYTLFFIATILVGRNVLKLADTLIIVLQISALVCIFFLPIIANIPSQSLDEKFKFGSYFIYLSYLIPTAYLFYMVVIQKTFRQSYLLQMISMFMLVYIISFEKYNSFMLITLNVEKNNYFHQQEIFRLILLSIIWAVMGFVFIYLGFKKQLKAFPVIGITLFGLIVLKLYLFDVWEMSNVFRIISFIVLGILILITSFMYQKLKILMLNLMDKPIEKSDIE